MMLMLMLMLMLMNITIMMMIRKGEDDEDNDDDSETVQGEAGGNSLGLAAMKWLLVLVDASIVYEAALATYDMDLTLMVAALSQRDPREYRPFIEHMRAVPGG